MNMLKLASGIFLIGALCVMPVFVNLIEENAKHKYILELEDAAIIETVSCMDNECSLQLVTTNKDEFYAIEKGKLEKGNAIIASKKDNSSLFAILKLVGLVVLSTVFITLCIMVLRLLVLVISWKVAHKARLPLLRFLKERF